MESNPYDSCADVYDAIYSYVQDDIPFYVEEAVESVGPVLELGCGTGRVAIPIAEAGVEVVGLDFSKQMLQVARRKAKQAMPRGESKLTLVHGDMRDFSLDRKFKLVIIPFRGFLSLLTVDDQVKCLETIRRHLEPDGRLIFDIFVPDPQMLAQDEDIAYHLRDVEDGEGGKIVLWHQTRYDHYSQAMSVRVTADVVAPGGDVSRRIYREFDLRYAHRWEMHHLLRTCGYEVLDLFGDFGMSPFEEGSEEMIWVARAAR
ncbi:MAG: class I SAM-dependent methyltransferase [SAR202 cluster bacterium]|nr:class I SAM-dependent methyltransferase [SAR202 cluster bacterium]